MSAAGITKVYTDLGVSGSLPSRPEFKALDRLEEGDVLVVWKRDRLGRNTRNVLEAIEGLAARDVVFRSLTEGLDTTGPMGRAMITIMAAFSELERSTMLERTPGPDLTPRKLKAKRAGARL